LTDVAISEKVVSVVTLKMCRTFKQAD